LAEKYTKFKFELKFAAVMLLCRVNHLIFGAGGGMPLSADKSQQCRIRVWRYEPEENLMVRIDGLNSVGAPSPVCFAPSDISLTGSFELKVDEPVALRSTALAEMRVDGTSMRLTAPLLAANKGTVDRYIYAVTNVYMYLWAEKTIENVRLRLTSSVTGSKAVVEFALGDLNKMTDLIASKQTIVPW
jgi:hypothetical protein